MKAYTPNKCVLHCHKVIAQSQSATRLHQTACANALDMVTQLVYHSLIGRCKAVDKHAVECKDTLCECSVALTNKRERASCYAVPRVDRVGSDRITGPLA